MSTQYKVTKELVYASLIPELANTEWQQLIEAGQNLGDITPETLAPTYDSLLKLRALHELLKERLAKEDEEDKANIKARKEGYDKVMKPMKEILDKADPIIFQINDKIIKEERLIKQEIEKQQELRQKHMDFVSEITKAIISTTIVKELAKIQMLVGTRKSHKDTYGDLSQTVENTCDSLLLLIDQRKKFINDNLKLEKDFIKYSEAKDMVKADQIKEEIELSKIVIEQNAKLLAEEAYKQLYAIVPASQELVSAAIKPRLNRWSWRVDDMETLYRRNPEMVDKVPNKKAIGVFKKEKESSGTLNPDEDNDFNGLVLYRKPFYVGISKTDDDAS